MKKIVEEPLKIDFHIHSEFSKFKDEYSLIKDGTIENLPILYDKLIENSIEMCAITDHDYFSYELYKGLKKYENHSLKKVFPGVEFSVGFQDDNGNAKPVHVICIFDDSDDDKVSKISSCIPFGYKSSFWTQFKRQFD